MKIKYDINIIKYISLFESVTRAKLKDCIVDNRVIFITNENEIGKAIGKNGNNIRKIENILKKKIKVVEFSNDVQQFIRNMIYPLQAKEIRDDDGNITITGPDTKTKALLIGRESQNLKNLKNAVKRYFPVKDIKVV